MKHLSLLLTLMLAGQSVFGGLKLQEWNGLVDKFKSEFTNTSSQSGKEALEALYVRILEIEQQLNDVNQSFTLEYVYNLIMPLLMGTEVIAWKNLSPEAKLVSKEVLKDMLIQLKEEVNAKLNNFTYLGKTINTAKSVASKIANGSSIVAKSAYEAVKQTAIGAKNDAVETAKSVGNQLAYGASVGINFANEHRTATARTAAAVVLGTAAYKNREALKAGASKVAAFAKETAPKVKPYVASKFENLCDSNFGQASRYTFYQGINAIKESPSNVVNKFDQICDSNLGLATRATFYQGVNAVKDNYQLASSKLSESYDLAYDNKKVINARIAMYEGIDKGREFLSNAGQRISANSKDLTAKASIKALQGLELVKAHPKKTVAITAGCAAATVGSAFAAVKMYNTYKANKAAKQAAELQEIRTTFKLNEEV